MLLTQVVVTSVSHLNFISVLLWSHSWSDFYVHCFVVVWRGTTRGMNVDRDEPDLNSIEFISRSCCCSWCWYLSCCSCCRLWWYFTLVITLCIQSCCCSPRVVHVDALFPDCCLWEKQSWWKLIFSLVIVLFSLSLFLSLSLVSLTKSLVLLLI